MTHPLFLRQKVRAIRLEEQLTIDQIAARLGLSRSTIYHWVRDTPIAASGSGGAWPDAARRKGNKVMQSKYRALREAAYREGLRSYDRLAARGPNFRDFVCLYIAEGYKRDRNIVSICNSDPAVIRICNAWILRLTGYPLEYRVQHHADQRPSELIRFWQASCTSSRVSSEPI